MKTTTHPRIIHNGVDITHRVYRSYRAPATGRYAPPTLRARLSARVHRGLATAWRWTRYALRLAAITLTVLALMGMAALYMHFEDSRPISASFQRSYALASLNLPSTFPAILGKICQAESHSSQTCTSALVRDGLCYKYEIGSPLISPNKNDTYDIGYCQINSIHIAEARAMKYDVINSEDDNKAYALFLFNSQGTEPWNSSKTNWK